MAATIDRPRRTRSLAVKIALAAVAAAGSIVSPRIAQAGSMAPWCAAQGGWGGGFDCSYYNFEQCMETARGLGNYCVPNPNARYVEHRHRRRHK
jgi:hypothetical protein